MWEVLAEQSISRQSVVLLDSMACRRKYSFRNMLLKRATMSPAVTDQQE